MGENSGFIWASIAMAPSIHADLNRPVSPVVAEAVAKPQHPKLLQRPSAGALSCLHPAERVTGLKSLWVEESRRSGATFSRTSSKVSYQHSKPMTCLDSVTDQKALQSRTL